jgi:hypothetical protein
MAAEYMPQYYRLDQIVHKKSSFGFKSNAIDTIENVELHQHMLLLSEIGSLQKM